MSFFFFVSSPLLSLPPLALVSLRNSAFALSLFSSLSLTVVATDPGWSTTVSHGMTSRRARLGAGAAEARRRRRLRLTIGAEPKPTASSFFDSLPAASSEAAGRAAARDKTAKMPRSAKKKPLIRSIECGKRGRNRGGGGKSGGGPCFFLSRRWRRSVPLSLCLPFLSLWISLGTFPPSLRSR